MFINKMYFMHCPESGLLHREWFYVWLEGGKIGKIIGLTTDGPCYTLLKYHSGGLKNHI